MALVNYDFYTDEYLGSAISDEDAFDRNVKKASVLLNRITFGNIIQNGNKYGTNIQGEFIPYNKEEIKALRYAICSAVDCISNIDTAVTLALAGNSNERNVKSVSSGGESITYDTPKNAYSDAVGNESEKHRLIISTLKSNLDIYAFRYNPLYAGVR